MHVQRPRWHSLIAQYSLSCLPESAAMGCDSLVRVFRLDPGLLVGLWKVRLRPCWDWVIPHSQHHPYSPLGVMVQGQSCNTAHCVAIVPALLLASREAPALGCCHTTNHLFCLDVSVHVIPFFTGLSAFSVWSIVLLSLVLSMCFPWQSLS